MKDQEFVIARALFEKLEQRLKDSFLMTPLTIVPLSLVKSLLHTMVMMKSFRFAAVIIALLSSFASAFHPSTSSIHSADAASQSLSRARQGALQASRRSFVEKATLSSIAIAGASLASAKTASASGGATAGGVYLLSAKQRYNARVTAGVKGFLAVGGALESGSIDVVRTFFTSEDDGSWKDFSAAGYLLANAFRRNSSAAPDTLPSVKVSYVDDG